MEIMNYLAPDVVTLGNHELDYGLPHLLFLEKMANFPIVNANLYIKKYHKRLMQPYIVLNVDGFDIMFIGIVTEDVMQSLKTDGQVGTFVGVADAAAEVGRICNAYKDADIDLTVLLTHIGFESDKRLAALLDPAWGVDVIIGGHSHTILEQPAVVNDILIVQAGVGTDQIGRFDLTVDDDTNRIAAWQWRLLPVDSQLAPPDAELEKFIQSYKEVVDRKYNSIICRFAQALTHPRREEETALGNLFADIFAMRSGVDVTFLGSGSLRGATLGPLVTLGDLYQIFAYDDILCRFAISGSQLKRVFAHFMRPDNRRGEGNCFQVNEGVEVIYNNTDQALVSLRLRGEPVRDDGQYTIALQGYHIKNSDANLGLSNAELTALAGSQVITTSTRDVLEEHLRRYQNVNSAVVGRLQYC